MRRLIAEGVKVQTCVTSPPYWGLRDYGHAEQLGLEKTPQEYVERMVEVFALVREILEDNGTLWLNIGDSYFGSWGNYGDAGGGQRDKQTERLDRKAYADKTEWRPPTSYPCPGLKPKDLCLIPARLAIALQAEGWYVRSDIIWHKTNPMPESVTDRPTKAHEYIWLMSKSERYYYDAAAIKERCKDVSIKRLGRGISEGNKMVKGAPGQTPHSLHAPRTNVKFGGNKAAGYGTRLHSGNDWTPPEGAEMANKRTVWSVPTRNYDGAHFATFPAELITPCILAGSKPGDVVFDPFGGSGTTGQVAESLGRRWILCELNEQYKPLWEERTAQCGLSL